MAMSARGLLLDIALTVVATGAAFLVRLLLDPILVDRFPFITFFIALMFVAWYAKLRPAVLTLVLGGLTANYFFVQPRYSFEIGDSELRFSISAYLILGLIYTLLNQSLHTARRRAEESARAASAQQRRLIREMTDRKSAEIRLRHSEAELHDFFENASLGLQLIGPDGAILRANRAQLDLLGFATGHYMGHHLAQFHADADVAADLLARLSRGETVRDFEARLRHKDGTLRHVLINANVLWDEGRFVHARCFVRDVTDLHRSEILFRQVVEGAPNGMIMVGPDGRIRLVNAQTERTFGYSQDELIGLPVELLVPERFRDQHLHDRAGFFATAAAARPMGSQRELFGRRKDGSEVPIEIGLNPIRTGSDTLVLAAVIDISLRKRAEESLRISHERLDWVVNSAELGLWFADLPLERLEWNPQCKEQFGLPADAVVTIDTFYERLHPGDRARAQQAIEEALAEARTCDLEYRVVGDGGPVRWIRFLGCVFRDAAGRPRRFDGVTVDVTAQKSIHESLKEADRRKDEFLAMLAHELRNPLAPIRNAVQLLRDKPVDDPEVTWARDVLDRQTQHLARLVDDLLDVSRITRGKINVRLEVVELATVLARAVETSRPLIEQRQHRLHVDLPAQPLPVRGDAVRLTQVFLNLLNNAAKYTADNGDIRLDAVRENGMVAVRVRDTGVGIPADMLAHIFDPFTQAQRSLDRAEGGLGIGLTLVRYISELHGGRVEALSGGTGRGSEFVVHLPLAAAVAVAEKERREPKERQAPDRRVLIVDDNRDAAESLGRLLRQLGHEVRVTFDGKEALAQAATYRPAIVLLDIGLPGLDGYQVARALRSQPGWDTVQLVALTGYGNAEARRQSRQAGFNAHLIKPVDLEELQAVLGYDAKRAT
jgi:PAS domain S-box-containing protein